MAPNGSRSKTEAGEIPEHAFEFENEPREPRINLLETLIFLEIFLCLLWQKHR